MKKIILLILALLLMSVLTFAQDSLIATHFTENGKVIRSMQTSRQFVLNQVSPDRTEFKIVQGDKVILDAVLKECVIIQERVERDVKITTRKIVVYDKLDGISKHEYLLTTLYSNITQTPIKFILTTIVKRQATTTYMGKLF